MKASANILSRYEIDISDFRPYKFNYQREVKHIYLYRKYYRVELTTYTPKDFIEYQASSTNTKW